MYVVGRHQKVYLHTVGCRSQAGKALCLTTTSWVEDGPLALPKEKQSQAVSQGVTVGGEHARCNDAANAWR